MRTYISFLFFSIFYLNSFGQCFLIDIEVLNEPFCQGSFNGGQLQANILGGSGLYSFQWKDDNGNNPPGGPQENSSTLSFLSVGQTYWVIVNDLVQDCIDSASFVFTDFSCQEDTARIEIENPFDINPVGYSQYTECDIRLTNLGCQLKFKPEFIISHPTENIRLNDFEIEFKNADSDWESIPYTINSNGDAVGYWGSQSGETASCDYVQPRPVRVKFNQFNPTSPPGVYSATLRLWSVDENGELLNIVSEEEQVNLTLNDTVCNTLNINSIVTDATCAGDIDGEIELNANGGIPPYQFSLNNSVYSTNNVFSSLTNGLYYYAVRDSNGCQNSDTLYLNPAPVLPDSLWFGEVQPFSADIYWDVDSLADGYKFRYREIGQETWQGPIASGFYSNGIPEMYTSKTINGLSPITTYEVQVKANSLTECAEEGWSTEYSFTTPLEVYLYDVVHTCVGDSSGQIYFNLISDNNYTFLWEGENDFTSTDTSIYQLAEGDYNLKVFNGESIVFDTTFTILVSNIKVGLTLNNNESLIIYSPQEQLYFAQTCDMNTYLNADDGFSNYVWNYGDSLQYFFGQNLLIDTSNIFVQVEALDSNNCLAKSDSINISLNSDFVNFSEANTNEQYIKSTYVMCSADSSIEIDISEFITGNYSLEWRQVVGQSTVFLSDSVQVELFPTENTNYQLNISNCTLDFYVNFFPSPRIDLQYSNLICYGDTNASLVVSTDSSLIISYTLFDSLGQNIYYNQSTSPIDTIENISVGKYTIEVKDEDLCSVEEEFEILQPDSIYFDSLQVQNIECYGQGLGSISFKVNGGVNPNIFVLNGDTIVLVPSQQGYYSIDELPPSSYTLEVSDSNNCYHSLNFEIVEPTLLSLSLDSYLDTINCFGSSNSYVNVSSSGGVSGYNYSLYSNDTLYSQQLNSSFTGLSKGNYEVFVTDQNGCKDSLEIVIDQNPGLTISENLNLHEDVLCKGENSGFISLSIEGGNFYSNNSSFTQNYDGLEAGYYTYTITDSVGCSTTSDSIQVLEPSGLTFTLFSTQNIDCERSYGSVEVGILLNESLPYTYSLNGGDTTSLVLADSLLVLDSLAEGSYTLTVIDSNDCVDLFTFSIQDLSNFSLSILNISETLACFNDTSGFVEVEVIVLNNVSENYQYSLYSNDSTLVFHQDSSYFDSLVAGEYGIVVVDDMGCVDSILFEINESPLLELNENLELHQDVMCDGTALGSITNIISGGTSPYTIGIVNDSLHAYPHQFNNLNVGEYEFIAIDFNGCTAELTVEITTNPISPELVLISKEPVDCQNLGSVVVELVSGNAPFEFKLNNAIQPVSLNAEDQFTISDLAQNTYQLTVQDDFLCTDTLDFEIEKITDIIFEIINSSDSLDCYLDSTGFVELGVQYGVLPFTFDLIKEGDTLVTQSSNQFSDLPIGDYLVTLTDSTNCHQELNFSVVSNEVNISDSLDFHKDLVCFGDQDGEFMLNITSEFSNHWIRLIDSANVTTYPWESHPHLFTNLSAGIYETEIVNSLTDDCPFYFDVEVIEPDSFSLNSFLVTDVACFGDSTGVFTPNISGGIPNYKYLFNNDSSIVSNALSAGAYYLEISDSNNCIIDTNFIISQPNKLTISVIDTLTSNVSCFGNNDGKIGVQALGGVPPYQFKINNGELQDLNVIDELVADTFLLSVVDSVGCIDTMTIILTQPDLNLFIDSYQLSDSLGYCALCYGDSSGFIDITITGGIPAYDFFIVNQPDTFTSPHIEKLVGGLEYEFFAIDAQGCFTDTVAVECTSPDELVLGLDTVTLPNCCYSCDAEVYIQAEGGISPYSYAFGNSTFQSDSLFGQLCGDSSYSFKILDTFGCEKEDSSLVVPNRLCLTVDTINFVDVDSTALIHYDICKTDGTAKIYTSAKEGVGDYSFSLDNQNFIQANEIMFDSLYEGAHVIVVQDELNCVDTLNFNVLEADPIIISELTVDTIFCGAPAINNSTGQPDVGRIDVVASGGSSGYYFYSLDSDSLLYQSSGVFDVLDSGLYSINIKDLNNCVKEFDIHIPHYSAYLDYSVSDISCPGFTDGIVEVDSFSVEGINSWLLLENNNLNSNLFTSLEAGPHEISVYYFRPDNNELCVQTESFEIMGKEMLDFSYKTLNSSCNGSCDGSISVESLSGGTSPYQLICMNTDDPGMNYIDLCAGEYAVKMTDSNSCFMIKNIFISEPNPIYPIIDYVDGNLVILEPTINNPLSGIPPYFYQWYDSNGEIVGANDSTFKASLPGTYSLVVYDSTNCVGESSNYNIEVLALNNWESELADIFPNPFKNTLNVNSYSDELIYWTLSDVRGRVILTGNNHKSWSLNTSELLNGIYFLKLNKGDKELIYKIIKQ